MPLKIIREDITKLHCDAIVNAANSSLLGGGGVDGAIHKAAGKRLLEKCMTLGGCATGEAKLTKGYDLPCKYIIHTVGPIWRGGIDGEEDLLRSCYQSSLALAKSKRCKTVAFPLISSGAYGYPKDQALRVAVDEITSFLSENDMLVYIVIFDRASYKISEKLFEDISSFIDDNYADEHLELSRNRIFGRSGMPFDKSADDLFESYAFDDEAYKETTFLEEAPAHPAVSASPHILRAPALSSAPKAKMTSLDDELKNIDESFSEMLLRKIDEKGLTDAECYKKANIDRKLFSKIRSNKLYKPSKATALAFCIALELSLEETKDMLMKAGFALSRSSKSDIIIEYFITNRNYNIFEINEALFAFDQNLLGA